MRQKCRFLPLIVAFVMIGGGLWMALDPTWFASNLSFILGVIIFLTGIEQVIYSIATKEYTYLPGFRILQGLLNVMIGIIFIFKPDASLTFLGVVFGFFALFGGVIKIDVAIRKARLHLPWIFHIGEGILEVIFAFLLIFNPFGGITAWTMFAGIFLLFSAFDIIISVFFIDRFIDYLE